MKRTYKLLPILVLVLIMVLVLGCSNRRTLQEAADSGGGLSGVAPIDTYPDPEEQEWEEEEGEEKFYMEEGGTVNRGLLEFTINSARWDKGDQYSKPEKGERWLAFDCTIENNTSKTDTIISSILMFALYDEDHYQRDKERLVNTKGSLDGELGAGKTMRGEIAFNVEEGQTKWEFIFDPNVFGVRQTIFLVKEKDVQ